MSTTWRNTQVAIDTEDKAKWCKEGERLEEEFVRFMTEQTDLIVRINPAKGRNPMAPDLLVPGYGDCDLKSIRTPFFTAEKYGVSPDDAITINHKDIIRYRQMYPELGIFFWVQWDTLTISRKGTRPVRYKWAVYFARLGEILNLVDSGIAKSHSYKHRNKVEENRQKERLNSFGMDTNKNAVASYVINTKWLEPILFSEKNPW